MVSCLSVNNNGIAGTFMLDNLVSQLKRLSNLVLQRTHVVEQVIPPVAFLKCIPSEYGYWLEWLQQNALVAGIISGWQLGLQGDAHELLIGILNSGLATAANVNDLIQFNMVTEGITYVGHAYFVIIITP